MAAACAAASLHCPVVQPALHSSQCGTCQYCDRVVYCSLLGVVCGVWCVVCVLFVWWGILQSFPPRRGGGWGCRGWWGGIAGWGGMALKGG
nr:MAG TPA: hypothetical protein [Caudoviricetes sp.]